MKNYTEDQITGFITLLANSSGSIVALEKQTDGVFVGHFQALLKRPFAGFPPAAIRANIKGGIWTIEDVVAKVVSYRAQFNTARDAQPGTDATLKLLARINEMEARLGRIEALVLVKEASTGPSEWFTPEKRHG